MLFPRQIDTAFCGRTGCLRNEFDLKSEIVQISYGFLED